MNILLIGMMGSGKTTLSKKLALILGYNDIDTDKIIELEQGCTVEQIFKYTNEQTFRKLETEVLKKLVGLENIVVATGGGVVLNPLNFKIMNKIGSIVYLYCPVEQLIKRLINQNNRPLIKENPKEKLTAIFEKRKNLYEKADFVVNTTFGQQYVLNKICDNFSLTLKK